MVGFSRDSTGVTGVALGSNPLNFRRAGVRALTDGHTGLLAQADAGTAVDAEAAGGTAVRAATTTGVGLLVEAGSDAQGAAACPSW